MSGDLPTHADIISAAEASGWLLEQHAARVLAAADMNPHVGWAFEDPDEPSTSRELDVWAYRQFLQDAQNRVTVAAHMLVECKQSSQPFLAIGQRGGLSRMNQAPTQHIFPVAEFSVPIGEGRSTYRSAWDHLGLSAMSRSHGDSGFRVSQLTRLNRGSGGKWLADNRGVFTDLVYPLAKAAHATKKPYSRMTVRKPRDNMSWTAVGIVFPVVLISAPLFLIDASTDEPSVEEARWVTAIRSLASKNVSGTFEIDIVTAGAFPSYLAERVEPFTTTVAEQVRFDPQWIFGPSNDDQT